MRLADRHTTSLTAPSDSMYATMQPHGCLGCWPLCLMPVPGRQQCHASTMRATICFSGANLVVTKCAARKMTDSSPVSMTLQLHMSCAQYPHSTHFALPFAFRHGTGGLGRQGGGRLARGSCGAGTHGAAAARDQRAGGTLHPGCPRQHGQGHPGAVRVSL